MTSLAKIPVTVITGFLGSGKTTLIRHLMINANGKKLAVLVNEFGSEGVDGEILKSCADANCPEENIVELANGCICCTVADDFIPTIEKLLSRKVRPDHILIETSGLALPKPLLKAFDWPEIRSRITVDGVIACRCGSRRGRAFCTGPGSSRRATRRRRKPGSRDAAVGSVRGPGLLRGYRAFDQSRSCRGAGG